MHKERLQYLIDRYKLGVCDEQELAELNNWYNSADFNDSEFEAWVKEHDGEANLADHLYHNFQAIQTKKKGIRLGSRMWQAAAAILLLLTFTVYFIKVRRPQNVPVVAKVVTPIKPGKNKAILTLADGSQVVLDDASNGKIASQAGVSVIKAANGHLVYKFKAGGPSNNAIGNQYFNSIYTPRGGQYQVILPDGTKVWLNSDSKLKFPLAFNGLDRKVELTGEGYFEVTHMAHVPFKVITGRHEIRVLGTHFNVKGYADEEKISTTLLQGSVQVNDKISGNNSMLIPGQQATFDKQKGAFKTEKVNAMNAIAWKNGYFLFDNEELRSILKVMGRWYDVEIRYDQANSEEHFGGTFSRKSDLIKILANLQEIGNEKFRIENRKIIVSPKNQ